MLVTVSFFVYGSQTERLVIKQTDEAAGLLVKDVLKTNHYKALGNYNFELSNDLWGEMNPQTDDLPYHHAKLLSPYSSKDPEEAAGATTSRERKDAPRAVPASHQC